MAVRYRAKSSETEHLFKDIRFAIRQLWKSRAFTFTAVVSLALGIGATTAVFSVIYAVLLHPFPYVAADRIVQISAEDKGGNPHPVFLTGTQLQQLARVNCVDAAIAWLNWELNTTGTDLPEDVKAVFITSNASRFFGVPPALGRGLAPADAPPGHEANAVVLLTDSFWSRHFNRNRQVIGRTLEMAHKPYTVVGVFPPRFAFNGGDVYIPLAIHYDPAGLYSFSLRLKPGVTAGAARPELQSLFDRFATQTPTRYPDRFHIHLERLNDRYVRSFGRTLYLLFGAVALLLFIGCANLSILLLARGAARQGELAVRAAIGASRARLLRQLLTESVTLSLIGASFGVLAAYAIIAGIVKWLPAYSVAREAAVELNLPVLAFSVFLALLTGVIFGLSPALQMIRPQLEQALRSGAHKIAGGRRAKRTHNILIGGQIALTLLLLTAAGASVEGFRQLMQVHLGYNPLNTLDINIPLHTNSHVAQPDRAAYFEALRSRVAALPGVASVALSSNGAPPYSGPAQHVELMGKAAAEWRQANLNLVSANYFSTLDIPLAGGRIWNSQEDRRAARLAVVNETMARQFWPDRSPIGQPIRLPQLKPQPPYHVAVPNSDGWLQIIGIVADSRNDGLLAPVEPAVYLPSTLWMDMGTDLLVHARTPPLRLVHAIRREIARVDPDQQVPAYTPTLQQLVEMQPEWQQGRLIAALCGFFAATALTLALIGLSSVVSYSVAQRTNEFGIRLALGASRENVLQTVLFSVLPSVAAGLAAGTLLALGLDRFLTKLGQGTGSHPALLLAVVCLLLCGCAATCALPAWRAASLDPTAALRQE
ncbi:MAG TPA: ABC transporter permease [Bryobacteraceae bacterium]|nr:ABC transporter permease [Bryobacteraceae bacterium]